MPQFGKTSKARLKTCDDKLQLLFNTVIERWDCSVLDGHRSKERQTHYFNEGRSKVEWPNGKHNSTPSRAVDVGPYINGAASYDARQCYYFAGTVMAVALMMGINIRWGGDWDGDGDLNDQSFNDLVHFELLD